MAVAKRSFALKIVRFKAGRRRGFVPPNMDDLMKRLFAAAPLIGARHLPTPATLSVGDSCFYLNRGKSRNGRDGYLIECVSYVNGLAPEQTTTNFTASTLPINSAPIVDPATGQTRQVIHSYRALFFGQCAIVELEKGGGGAGTLSLALTHLLRVHVDPTLPAIEFMDVVGADLRKSIVAGGGVARITARLAKGTMNANRPLAIRLSRLKRWAGGRAVVNAEIEFSDGDDHVNKGIAALDEFATDNLDSVAVYLRDGQKITGLKKFVEKRRLDITLTPSGAYDPVEIENTMWNYLDELRRPDDEGWRIIDSGGRPAGATVIDDPDA